MEWDDPLVQIIAALATVLVLTMWAALVLPHVEAQKLRQLIQGVKTPPLLVAWLRRGLTLLFTLLIVAVSGWIGFEEGKDRVIAGGVAAMLAESAWGLFDQLFKPGQNDIDPKAVAGGGSAELGGG